MIEIKRDEFIKDAVFHKLYEVIKRNHQVGKSTMAKLKENSHIKDFCVDTRHFTIIPGESPYYMHYDVWSWYQPDEDGALISIRAYTVYDNFMEYETARMKQLHSGKDADIPNIN